MFGSCSNHGFAQDFVFHLSIWQLVTYAKGASKSHPSFTLVLHWHFTMLSYMCQFLLSLDSRAHKLCRMINMCMLPGEWGGHCSPSIGKFQFWILSSQTRFFMQTDRWGEVLSCKQFKRNHMNSILFESSLNTTKSYFKHWVWAFLKMHFWHIWKLVKTIGNT